MHIKFPACSARGRKFHLPLKAGSGENVPARGPGRSCPPGTAAFGKAMDASSHDVLLVGGGGAGLRAAIAAAEVNPKLRIAVISKVYPMRSHTVSAEGGAAGVIKPDDSLDEHAYDTISGGDWLCDQDAVEAFAKEAPQELLHLERWGCPWSREPDGHIAVRAFGGMKKRRTKPASTCCTRCFRPP